MMPLALHKSYDIWSSFPKLPYGQHKKKRKSSRLSRKVQSVWSIYFVFYLTRLQSKCGKRLLALSPLSVCPSLRM